MVYTRIGTRECSAKTQKAGEAGKRSCITWVSRGYMCVCVCSARMPAWQVNTVEWRVAADVIFARLMSLMESGAYLAGATQFAGCD